MCVHISNDTYKYFKVGGSDKDIFGFKIRSLDILHSLHVDVQDADSACLLYLLHGHFTRKITTWDEENVLL